MVEHSREISVVMYEIISRPTLEHSNADGLSRLPLQVLEEDEEGRETSVLSVLQLETLPVMPHVMILC